MREMTWTHLGLATPRDHRDRGGSAQSGARFVAVQGQPIGPNKVAQGIFARLGRKSFEKVIYKMKTRRRELVWGDDGSRQPQVLLRRIGGRVDPWTIAAANRFVIPVSGWTNPRTVAPHGSKSPKALAR